MAKVYVYVETIDTTYTVVCKREGHANMRIAQRFIDAIIDDDFIANRLCVLMENNIDLADTIVNDVRIGESFIIEDEQQNLSIVVYHQLEELRIGTIFSNYCGLKKFDGQKVIRLLKDGSFRTYTFNRTSPFEMEGAWGECAFV